MANLNLFSNSLHKSALLKEKEGKSVCIILHVSKYSHSEKRSKLIVASFLGFFLHFTLQIFTRDTCKVS